MRTRLDRLMVDRGLAGSREKAQALIMAGEVRVNGQRAAKPGQAVDGAATLEVLSRPPYVSRGGFKLAGALQGFGLDLAGKTCLDIGSSTGGFTDAMLQAGAARVHAVDVGAGQLDWKLRSDPRVVVHEGINARELRFEDIGERADFLACDVSFISVALILPAIVPLLRPDGQMVILIKPQFEAGRGQVGKGGIVRDPEVHRAACQRIEQAVRETGFQTAIIESPIHGAEGNKEFLLYAHH
ncbi:MAG TPA: TlyA family RNA methyltransferase [Candidatus Acidoferrales bacterium]|nr:TlyA family RNA methyltransferase [Candidatus Acidoferrales bacterium]